MQPIWPGRLHAQPVSHPPVHIHLVPIFKIPKEDIWLVQLVISDLHTGVCGDISGQSAKIRQI